MKINELRIGNLLREKVTKTELKVIELTENNIVTYVIDRSLYPLYSGWEMEPIQLDKKSLLKFGFKHQYENIKGVDFFDYHIDDNFSLYVNLNKMNISVSKKNIGNVFTKDIQYVHQLQNLYFALTGEELSYTQNLKCTCAYESQYRNCSKQCERDND